MHATEVIEAYIDDTVRLLPRHQRDDVAAELRSLLNEELNARTRDSGRPLKRPWHCRWCAAMATRTRSRLAISQPGPSSPPLIPGVL